MVPTSRRDRVHSFFPARFLRHGISINGPKLLGLEKERGSLAVGLAADLVGMRGNPMEDPRALTNIDFVMKDGRVHRHDRR
jgi:imidazolonepropionase-like amidohydrolase